MAQQILNIPIGYTASFTTDDLTSGNYTRYDNIRTGYAPVAVDVSTSYSLGPFNELANFEFITDGDQLIEFSLGFSGVVTASDEALIDSKQQELSGAALTSATVAGNDKVLIQDTSNSNNLKTVTAQSIADLVIDSVVAENKQDIVEGVSNTEIGYLDGVTSAIQTQLDDEASARTTADGLLSPKINITHIGVAATGVVAAEKGNGYTNTTVLTVASVLPAITGGADQAVGKLLYTFPAGSILVKACYMSVGITQSEAHIDADTPEIGLGTVIGTGAVAILDTPNTFENLLTGQVAADCAGTATVKTVADQVFVIEAGDAHTVHLNAAFGWAASGDAAAAIAGTVVLEWQFMN